MRKPLKDFKAGEKCWLPVDSDYSLARLDWCSYIVEGTIMSAPKDNIVLVGFPRDTKFAVAKLTSPIQLDYDYIHCVGRFAGTNVALDDPKDFIVREITSCPVTFIFGKNIKVGDTVAYASASRQCYIEIHSIEEQEDDKGEAQLTCSGKVFRSVPEGIAEWDTCTLWPKTKYLLLDRNGSETIDAREANKEIP